MERDYLAAALPEPFTILGQRLNPFSLGHLLLLRRFESGFAVPGKAPTIDDLTFAVFVCSQTYESAAASLADPGLKEQIAAWAGHLEPFDTAEKIEVFQKYLIDGSQCPEMNEDGQNHRQPGAPFIHRVRMVLQGRLNYSFNEAMNCPWGLALWDYFGFWEMEGAVRLFSQEDAERIEAAKSLMEALRGEEGWLPLSEARN